MPQVRISKRGHAAPGPGASLPAAARALLDRTRAEWRRTTVLRVVLGGLAAAVALAVVLVLLDQALSLPVVARQVLRVLPPLVALGFAVPTVARILPGPDDRRLALLAEERRPELGYGLVTLLQVAGEGPVARAFARRQEPELARLAGPVVPLRAPGELRRLGLAVASAALVLLSVPGGPGELRARWVRLAAGPAAGMAPPGMAPVGRTAEAARRAFGDVRVRVEPPAYTGLPPWETTPADPVAALAGSRVEVGGAAPAGTTVTRARLLGSGREGLDRDGGRFAVGWTLGPDDRGIELVAVRGDVVLARQVIPLSVRADSLPVVELVEPSEDLVLASPRGSVKIEATARDDQDVADFRLTWILSRGGGESFSFTDGGVEWETLRVAGGTHTGTYALDLERLGVGPGDVLHVRAVARDGNTFDGPGEGVSRTRVIRVAREGETGEVNTLIAFPMEVEGDPILTQRMIILLTERLLERAPGLAPEELRTDADEVAREQARLRERLADVIYARTGGAEEHDDHADDAAVAAVAPPLPPSGDTLDATARARRMEEVLEAASRATGTGTPEELAHDHDPDPALAVNLDLVPAFNAMYEAERHLRLAELDAALPHEYRALEVIQAVREAERVYVRGTQTVAPVDVDGARGTGSVADAEPAARSPASPRPSPSRHAAALVELASAMADAPPAEASALASAMAASLLEDPAVDAGAGALLALAAEAAFAGRVSRARSLLAEARALVEPPGGGRRAPASVAPASAAGAAFLARLPADAPVGPGDRVGGPDHPPAPFVFATARYASGDWDSAPLVPANLVHSLALYTDIPVAPEGVVVDLDSPDLFRHPVVFLTGHLPVRFSAAEARNVREYVDRGGFLFVDDHNHDVDGAFHRTVTAELARVFGADALVELPNDHEIYRAFFVFENGPPTTSHELNGWGDGLVHEHLLAVEREGRVGVLYSNKDYASEWSYHAVNKRFLAVDNTRFGVNVLVYALTR